MSLSGVARPANICPLAVDGRPVCPRPPPPLRRRPVVGAFVCLPLGRRSSRRIVMVRCLASVARAPADALLVLFLPPRPRARGRAPPAGRPRGDEDRILMQGMGTLSRVRTHCVQAGCSPPSPSRVALSGPKQGPPESLPSAGDQTDVGRARFLACPEGVGSDEEERDRPRKPDERRTDGWMHSRWAGPWLVAEPRTTFGQVPWRR